MGAEGELLRTERRLYDDVVTLTTDMPSAITGSASVRPAAPLLAPPYPNPFNSTVLIRFGLDQTEAVQLDVLDLGGQVIRRLVHSQRATGYHSTEWDGRDGEGREVASGVYLISLRSESCRDTAKVMLVR
jgi:flagellar hook capping protein FlgD